MYPRGVGSGAVAEFRSSGGIYGRPSGVKGEFGDSVKLRAVICPACLRGAGGTEKLAEFLKGWEPESYNPRKKLKLD